MKKIMFMMVVLSVFAFSCGSMMKTPSVGSGSKKDCKDQCKDLKGKERADCNKRCN